MMSSVTTETRVLPYIQAQETSETLEWADLATLDLSKFDHPGGKHELAAEFTKAMEEIGKSGAWVPQTSKKTALANHVVA